MAHTVQMTGRAPLDPQLFLGPPNARFTGPKSQHAVFGCFTVSTIHYNTLFIGCLGNWQG